jgi:hypothetical protein
VLRLFGFFLLAGVGAAGILFLDFNRTVQQAGAADEPPPSFRTYIASVPDRLASMSGSSVASDTIVALSDMLPRAPEGWTMRPLDAADIKSFLPKGRDDGDPAVIDLVKAVGNNRVEEGATVAIQAYERGERRVVIQLVRLPDRIFQQPAAIERRYDLQVQAAELRGRPFMTVRGLDVTEELLGDGMRARFFSASVGAQIRVRVLASKRLKDAELVPFFETLNVRAMNASVVDRQAGLGELPVLVLASALNESDLAAFEADRTARGAQAILRAQEVRADALAEAETAMDTNETDTTGKQPKPGLSSDCQKDSGKDNRCSVTPDG